MSTIYSALINSFVSVRLRCGFSMSSTPAEQPIRFTPILFKQQIKTEA